MAHYFAHSDPLVLGVKKSIQFAVFIEHSHLFLRFLSIKKYILMLKMDNNNNKIICSFHKPSQFTLGTSISFGIGSFSSFIVVGIVVVFVVVVVL